MEDKLVKLQKRVVGY